MARGASILVAHNSPDMRDMIAAALYEAGFESVQAIDGQGVLRTTIDLKPGLVIVQAGLDQVSGYELPARLKANGLDLPPIIILFDADDELPENMPEGEVYCVFSEDLNVVRLTQSVKLLLLAREIGGEFGETLDVMHGDLTRTPFGDVLGAAQRYALTGRLEFSRGLETGLWLAEGSVVDAWWGLINGMKAFNRIAGLPSGGYSLRLSDFDGEMTMGGFVGDLIVDALDERFGFDEVMSSLPSPESCPEIQMVADIFNMEFSAVERQLLSRAQDAASLSDLIDAVSATDFEAAKGIANLTERGLLTFKENLTKSFIFTDSTADLLPSDARRMGITVIPVSIVFGSDVYRDGVDLQPEGYFKMLKEKKMSPVTHPVSKGEFFEAYRRVIGEGDILGIYCSSKLSRTFINATEAVKEGMAEFRAQRSETGATSEPALYTIDSGQCSGSLGLLSIFAVRFLRSGCSLREVASHISDIRSRMRTVLVVKTLDQLVETGAVTPQAMKEAGKEAAKKGGKGSDGPFILELFGGELKLRDRKPAGPRTRARVLEILSKGVDISKPVFAAIVHASAPAEAAAIRPQIHELFEIEEMVEEQTGPAVTSHSGPGAFGVGIFQPTPGEMRMLRRG